MALAYLILLNLYPRDYKLHFRAEMAEAFEVMLQEHRRSGRLWVVRFIVAELTTLLMNVAAEWKDKATSNPSARWRCLPDFMIMRPPGVSRACWYKAAGRMRFRADAYFAKSSRENAGENS
jgi:hypothetical protein